MKLYQYINKNKETDRTFLKPIFDKINNSSIRNLINDLRLDLNQVSVIFKDITCSVLTLCKSVYIAKNKNGSPEQLLDLKVYEETKLNSTHNIYTSKEGNRISTPENIIEGLEAIYNDGQILYARDLIHNFDAINKETKKLFEMHKPDKPVMVLLYNIMTPDVRINLVKEKPEIIHNIFHPSKEEIQYVMNNARWTLTDQIFSRCSTDCQDLEKQWSNSTVRKARKQIGL